MESKGQIAVIIGAGDSLGSAIARRFAREGFTVCVARRNVEKLQPLVDEITREGGKVLPFGCDARREEQIAEMFSKIERECGAIEVFVFNIGGNVRFNVQETTVRVYTKVWELCALAGFISGREAVKYMAPRGRGTMIFTGATASLRGSAGYSAFSGGKHALRSLAQSMAREFGKQGIHVAHVIIDGPIDTPFVRERFPDMVKSRPADGLLAPDDIAENYWHLHKQKRSAWTFELDVRPWLEPW
jgi:NAD(P)-dependent dehydrogenase (short-subunit alcohol dehydrogenase family)